MERSEKIPIAVIHHGRHDPRRRVGGVETFARTLEQIFAEVHYTSPGHQVVPGAPGSGGLQAPIICDNQQVLDWPPEVPVIGFQHGVAAVKMRATRAPGRWLLARRQRLAARRLNTLWVACAEWVSDTFQSLHGNAASHVIYHPVDTDRFDGELCNHGSRLVLHDARTRAKGRHLIERIAAALPEWRFEPLSCPPADVPDRMRRARAFLHLSRYEGNSLVCLEAMAMNLPCLFTEVGLMRDRHQPPSVRVLDPDLVFAQPKRAVIEVRRFLDSLSAHAYEPRAWVLQHATVEHARAGWRSAMASFAQMTAPTDARGR